jgi:hypothetical protein
MHLAFISPQAIGLAALTIASLFASPKVQADAGHEHGDAKSSASSPGLARFAATSDLFELVGVVSGKQLTLYLDRSADNSPVKGAKLELELGGAKVDVKPRADGAFEANLPQPLKPGTITVTATVTADQESDLLAGEFMLPEEVRAEAPNSRNWRQVLAWAAAGLSVFAVLAWLGRRPWRQRSARTGGAT